MTAKSVQTIWKFHLPLTDDVAVQMPDGAHILSVGVQHGGIYLWALSDPSAKKVTRRFRIVGTGHPFADWQHCHFLGTVHLADGSLIFHVHELLVKQ